jgi:hypothetical protein
VLFGFVRFSSLLKTDYLESITRVGAAARNKKKTFFSVTETMFVAAVSLLRRAERDGMTNAARGAPTRVGRRKSQ